MMSFSSRLALPLCLLAGTLMLSACGDSGNNTATAKSDVPVTLTDDIRARGVAPDTTTSVFILALFPLRVGPDLYLT